MYVEVKRGSRSPLEFGWFARTLPQSRLLLVGGSRHASDSITALTLADFLRAPAW